MELPIEDVLEIQQLNAIYALRMTQGDINHIMEEVFTADGSYSAFGDTYGLADWPSLVEAAPKGRFLTGEPMPELDEIGRASGRARVCQYGESSWVAESLKKKNT